MPRFSSPAVLAVAVALAAVSIPDANGKSERSRLLLSRLSFPLRQVKRVAPAVVNVYAQHIVENTHLTLTSTGTACIDSVTFERGTGREAEAKWKHSDKPNVVDVTLSLKSVDPGNIHLDVHQYGGTQTAAVTAQTFSEPAQLDGLTLHAGDSAATLTGTSLDQVRQLSLSNLDFHPLGDPTLVPSQTGSNQHTQRLTLSLPESAQPPSVHPGDHLVAHLLSVTAASSVSPSSSILHGLR